MSTCLQVPRASLGQGVGRIDLAVAEMLARLHVTPGDGGAKQERGDGYAGEPGQSAKQDEAETSCCSPQQSRAGGAEKKCPRRKLGKPTRD